MLWGGAVPSRSSLKQCAISEYSGIWFGYDTNSIKPSDIFIHNVSGVNLDMLNHLSFALSYSFSLPLVRTGVGAEPPQSG